MKIFPALCTVAGTIFSCTNYFGVIFTGGVGKNGSTIAVSTLSCLSYCAACWGSSAMLWVVIWHNTSYIWNVLLSFPCLASEKQVNIVCVRTVALGVKSFNILEYLKVLMVLWYLLLNWSYDAGCINTLSPKLFIEKSGVKIHSEGSLRGLVVVLCLVKICLGHIASEGVQVEASAQAPPSVCEGGGWSWSPGSFPKGNSLPA